MLHYEYVTKLLKEGKKIGEIRYHDNGHLYEIVILQLTDNSMYGIIYKDGKLSDFDFMR